MIRIMIYVILVVVFVSISIWISDRPGVVILEWQGWRIDTTFSIFLLFILFIVVILALVLRFLGMLHALPQTLQRKWSQYRRSRGYAALNSGFAAVAAGDAIHATRMANEAGGCLIDSHTSLLLQAQAAELAGDEISARKYYGLLRARPTTELIGLKGLIAAAYRAGQQSQVLDLARRAVAVRPVNWAVQTLFDALVRERLWAEASQTLGNHRANVFKPLEKAKRYQVVLDTQRALEAETTGDSREALRLVRRALRRDSGMVPAAILGAQLYTAAGKSRKAARLIEAAWSRTLHPRLVQTYFDIWPSDDAGRRMQRAERLVAVTGHPEHGENRLLVACTALEAQRWDKARSQIRPLLSAEVLSRRVAVFMARLEQLEHNDIATAETWRQRASAAPADGWRCRICGTDSAQWDACCARCGNFDSLVWVSASVQAHPCTRPGTTVLYNI